MNGRIPVLEKLMESGHRTEINAYYRGIDDTFRAIYEEAKASQKFNEVDELYQLLKSVREDLLGDN